MKKLSVLVSGIAMMLIISITGLTLFAQDNSVFEALLEKTARTAGIKQIPRSIEISKAIGSNFERRDLFAQDARPISDDEDLRSAVSGGVIVSLNNKAVRDIISDRPQFVTLSLPDGKGGIIDLELEQFDIFAPGFKVTTSAPTGQSAKAGYGLHYRGIVKGDSYSLVAISIFPTEIMGSVRSRVVGNGVLGRLNGNNPTNSHIFYNANDLKSRPAEFCAVNKTERRSIPIPAAPAQYQDAVAAKVTRIYTEANFDLFTNKGTVPNTTAYITGFFNQSAVLFANDGILVRLQEIFVWTTASPYTSTTSSGELAIFKATRTTFNGDLAHLITLKGYGGIAYVDVLCVPTFNYAVSGVEPTFLNVPTFSWTVEVFTHETGHNLASPHTQACVWNGNNTAIDSCVPVEGACAPPGPPAGPGTIMSYCHLVANGISFPLGFGTQPKALIQSRITAASCLQQASRAPFDYDGDNKTDIGIFRPAAGEWWYQRSSNGTNGALQFGISTDKPVPNDYTGDGKADIAFWRPSTGQWFILRSEDLSFYAFPFGANGDKPIPADYDGDGKADAAVFRPTGNQWFINKSTGGTTITTFGAAGDLPVVANYDGDTKADIAIFRPTGVAGSEWWIQRSSNSTVFALTFGTSTDKPVPGDYTGDGKADVAIWRPSNGNWFILRSEDFSFYAFPFGANGDMPIPGDYDGDGNNDAAVFRPTGNTWFLQRSTAGTLIQTFGSAGDYPVANTYVP